MCQLGGGVGALCVELFFVQAEDGIRDGYR